MTMLGMAIKEQNYQPSRREIIDLNRYRDIDPRDFEDDVRPEPVRLRNGALELAVKMSALEERLAHLEEEVQNFHSKQGSTALRERYLEIIEPLVAGLFSLKPEDLYHRSHAPNYTVPRSIAMYLWHKNGWSLPQIGRRYRMHHTSVMAAVRRIEKEQKRTPKIKKAIGKVQAAIEHARSNA